MGNGKCELLPPKYPVRYPLNIQLAMTRTNALFDVLHTAHVLPVRPAYTPDGLSGIIHECGGPARTNDDPARKVRAAAPPAGRVCAAYAGDHALQCVKDVRTSGADVHSWWKRRAQHARWASRDSGPVYIEPEGKRGMRRCAWLHERGELGEQGVERICHIIAPISSSGIERPKFPYLGP